MDTKQFTGFLSSSANPGQLSLTVSSLINVVIGLAATYAVVHGLDAKVITTQVQAIIETVVTGVTAAFTAYHAMMVAYGLLRKLWYALFAKQVVAGQAIAA